MQYVFTEQGVASLSGVLKSTRASEVHVRLMRAFVEMRRFFLKNEEVFAYIETVKQRQLTFESETTKNFDRVFQALESGQDEPDQGIFFDGQMFDAYSFVSALIRKARHSVILIDNYVDDSVLTMLSKRNKNVSANIFTKNISRQLKLDLKIHNSQYPSIEVKEMRNSHDRFLILDKEHVYHIGASLKDLGKKWFAFSLIDKAAVKIMDRLDKMDIENQSL